jgi:SET domain-containing protein
MLTVKTYIKEVPGKGIGLFANEKIKKNTVVHLEETEFDKIFSNDFVLEHNLTSFFKHYATFDKESSTWYLCSDNARFINHSYNPNITCSAEDKKSWAIHDIEIDEEITVDYTTICDDIRLNGFDFKVS